MENKEVKQYKPSKKLDEQISYLKYKKKVTFNKITEEDACEKLLRYNYINIITPFKHRFAKKTKNEILIKENGAHIYEKDVEFDEYFNFFNKEREHYPIIAKNIMDFEIHFKSIIAYNVLTTYYIENSCQLEKFLEHLKLKFINLKYSNKRKEHMRNQIDELKKNIGNYVNVYCFFDRMSLGKLLTIYICLDKQVQDLIFSKLKEYGYTFNVDKISDFIDKVFCLVSVRNCVMHCNSLEILIRFYNPKTHELRKVSDRKKYLKMIKLLSIEKTHDNS